MSIRDTHFDNNLPNNPALADELLASLCVTDNGPKTFAETFMEVCEELPPAEQALIEESLGDFVDADATVGINDKPWGEDENDDLDLAFADPIWDDEGWDTYPDMPEMTGNAEIDLAILGGCITPPPEFESVDVDVDGDTYVMMAQEGEFFLAADGRFGYRVTLPNHAVPVEVTLLDPDKNVFASCIDELVQFGTTLMSGKWYFVVMGPMLGGSKDSLDFTFDPTTGTAEDIRVFDGTAVDQNTVLFGVLPAEIEYADEAGEDGEVVSYVKNVIKIFTAGFPQSFVEMLEKLVVLATVHGHKMPQPVIRVEAPHDLTKAPTFGGEPIVEAESDTVE